ncbi:uracil-DNA glycosylase [Nocardia sp. NPDC003963]
MRDPEYRRTQYAQIYDSHIEPINRLVDRLREESGAWVPHVAPIYGGTGARVLAVFRDPGPTTQQDSGSGMLSLENDDPSAERHLGLVENSGLAATDLISWNAYPWYINRTPTGVEIDRGAEAMQRLIELLPELVVVVVHGKDAQTAWRRFVRSGRSAGRQLDVVTTYHTSRQAFRTSDPDERARREKKLVDDYARVAALLADAPR